MRNIQESAAGNCVQKIDPTKVALAKQAPLTLKQLGLEMPGDVAFTKKDLEEAPKKASRKVKK